MESCLYVGWVKHRRFRPVIHHFRYRLFLVCLDLTDLDGTFRGSWTWAWRRPGLAWFRRGDHLGDPHEPLETSVRDLVERSGRPRPRGRILLVTNLRYWGFVFNPVSFYFCLDEHGQWETMVAEVSNTPWNQKHCYLVDRASPPDSPKPNGIKLTDKVFHVSPFLTLDYGYRWSVKLTADHLVMHIENFANPPSATTGNDPSSRSSAVGSAAPSPSCSRPLQDFNVTLSLSRRPWSRWERWRLMLVFPGLTLQIVAKIYWQALRLWWKRVPYVPHPGLPETTQQVEFPGRGRISVSS